MVNDELKAVFANTGTEVVEIQRLSLSSALIELSSLDDAVKDLGSDDDLADEFGMVKELDDSDIEVSQSVSQ